MKVGEPSYQRFSDIIFSNKGLASGESYYSQEFLAKRTASCGIPK